MAPIPPPTPQPPTEQELERLVRLFEACRAHGVHHIHLPGVDVVFTPEIGTMPPEAPLSTREEAKEEARKVALDPLFDAVGGPPRELLDTAGLNHE